MKFNKLATMQMFNHDVTAIDFQMHIDVVAS